MKIFFSGGKLGSPAKQRSRSISTRKREVVERIHLITTNTNLRSLSFESNGKSPKVTVGNTLT